MKLEKMFKPLKIGTCEIPNRFAVTAMVTDMCDENGYATEQYLKYHEAKAKGGYGLIITEDYAVNEHAGGYKRVAKIYKEDMITGHKKVVDAVHQYGTKIFCQIYHAGRQTNSHVNGGAQVVAASASACPWNREMARELTADEIKSIVKDFGVTARNVKKAGFDGIEIHAGNGYLIAGFLSHYQNKRTDRYGGCFTNRIRILDEIYQEVRAQVGNDYPVIVRFSSDEHTLDGRTIAETRMLAKHIEEMGFDAINCSNGVYGTYNLAQVSTSFLPHAWTTENAYEVKKIVNIPVMGVNSIDDPLMAENLLESGKCDFVGMSRCSLADPEMPNKAKEGRFDEIRPCVRCLQGCTTNTIKQIPIQCCVNPTLGLEYKYTFEDKVEPKKVLIVGGGPAGMEAAAAAAKRGHKVTLWEKTEKLGGELLAGAVPPGKGEFATFLAALTREIELLNVDVVYGKEAIAEEIRKGDFDKVILATGGIPTKPSIPGIDNANIYMARDIILGKYQVQGRLIVAGGGEVGIETAMYLADQERGHITILEMLDTVTPTTDPCRLVLMKKFLQEREVSIMTGTKVVEIKENAVVAEKNGEKIILPYDGIVVSMGYHSNTSLTEELKDLGDKVVTVGDAVKCADAMESCARGYEAGYYA
ncbi:MAG: FAD-dependent oxidoreductase [Dehalobacterium sp.]